jgi:hypothetical protein
MRTSAILLDIRLAVRTLLCGGFDLSNRLVLFVEAIFSPQLVCSARFTIVIRSIARNASTGATLVASADIVRAFSGSLVSLAGFTLRS